MPPKGVTSAKRKRQYEKIKASAKKQGRSEGTAKRIAAATTNKTRAQQGETKGRKRSTGGSRKRSTSRKSASASRKTGTRKSTSRKSTSRKSTSRRSSSSKKR